MLNSIDIQELSGTLTTNGRTLTGNFQENLLISSRFPGGIIPVDFQDFQEC